jgi:hypothetical protein
LTEGYVYFDLFNQNVGSNPVRLISPAIKAVQEQSLCFTFWFAVFGAGESAQLRVVRQDNSSSDNGEQSPQEKAKLELSLQLYIIIIIIIILYPPCQHPFNYAKATESSTMHGKDDSNQDFPLFFIILPTVTLPSSTVWNVQTIKVTVSNKVYQHSCEWNG